jgi:hypothetical protein
MIALINIAHSGTGFALSHLCAGMTSVQINEGYESLLPVDVVFAHAEPNSYDMIRKVLPTCIGAFATYRDRTALENSWLSRGGIVADLDKSIETMSAIAVEFGVLPLHLDRTDLREKELLAINSRLRVNFSTDWRVVPSWGVL